MSIKSLQTKIGITPDGSIGPATLKAFKNYFKLTNEQVAHFFGQVGHETGEYKSFSENLNYSAEGLKKTFGKYFPGTLNESYAKQPEKIASHVYANRMGNGDESSGDGWKYRGRGALQLTGKNNYQEFSNYLKKPEIMTNPDLVSTEYAFESAMFFFDKNKLWSIADKGVNDDTILIMTKRINGGTLGLDHRKTLTLKYYNWLQS